MPKRGGRQVAIQQAGKQLPSSIPPPPPPPPPPPGERRPYTSDLEYLEDSFKLLMTQLVCGKHRRVLAHSEEGDNAGGLAGVGEGVGEREGEGEGVVEREGRGSDSSRHKEWK